MKKYLYTLPLFLLACGSQEAASENNAESTESQTDSTQTETDTDDLSGTYEWRSPYNDLNYIENHYMVLEKNSDDTYTGRYYGRTDIFDKERTEYAQGYFVLPMTDLKIENGVMTFSIIPTQDDLFAETIDLSIMNSTEAKEKGLAPWEVWTTWEKADLTAKIQGGNITLEGQEEEMIFIPME